MTDIKDELRDALTSIVAKNIEIRGLHDTLGDMAKLMTNLSKLSGPKDIVFENSGGSVVIKNSLPTPS
jgi:hypothetical protein